MSQILQYLGTDSFLEEKQLNMEFNNPHLIKNSRQKYLQIWNNKYPMPIGFGSCGMIVFSENKIFIERNGEAIAQIKLDLSSFYQEENRVECTPLEVLKSGDWIEYSLFKAVNIESDRLKYNDPVSIEFIQLLSPNMLDDGHRSEVKNSIRQWSQFLKRVTLFFDSNGFDFIGTPTLVECPGTEPCLEPFITEFVYGSQKKRLFLPTSPELHLKKCLAMGWDKIYELKTCFRNGEISPIHQPEFYLLEWYRSFSSLNEIESDLKKLIYSISPKMVSKSWVRKSVSELFQMYFDFELTPSTKMEDLGELAHKNQIDITSAVDFDEVFYFLYLKGIEPRLKTFDCLIVYNYPPSQAALARMTKEGWGDRFELYIQGIEIANAFCEFNNPFEQRNRALDDLKKKEIYNKTQVGLDEEFFQSLERGMPPSSGIALGLERLFLVLNDYTSISDIRIFKIDNVN